MYRRAAFAVPLLLMASKKAFGGGGSFSGGIRAPTGREREMPPAAPLGAQGTENFSFAGTAILSAGGYLRFNRDVSRFVERKHDQLRSPGPRRTDAFVDVTSFLDPLINYLAANLDMQVLANEINLDASHDGAISVRTPPTAVRLCNPSGRSCNYGGRLDRIFSPSVASQFLWTAHADGWVGYSRSTPAMVSVRAAVNLKVWTQIPVALDRIVNRPALNEEARAILLETMQIYDVYIREKYRGLSMTTLPADFNERLLPNPRN
jgi:hypothetical protein